VNSKGNECPKNGKRVEGEAEPISVKSEQHGCLPECSGTAPDAFAALKAYLDGRNIATPIDVDKDGNRLGGHHRRTWCELHAADNVRSGRPEPCGKALVRLSSECPRRPSDARAVAGTGVPELRDTPEWTKSQIVSESCPHQMHRIAFTKARAAAHE
jgi:hypothetical protein